MDASSYNCLMRLTPYELHKRLINHYVLRSKESLKILKRDTSRDKRDIDVIRENHRFLWDGDSEADTWEKKLAKKYYDKLFKEYCICDLTCYKENKIAMRWQTEQELISGKGQFTCGEKACKVNSDLRTWEVNFGYTEQAEKKNALVKLRLCPDCSIKLNYSYQRKEVKIKKVKRLHTNFTLQDSLKKNLNKKSVVNTEIKNKEQVSQVDLGSVERSNNIWKEGNPILEGPSRDEEFEEYLEDLLL